LFQAKGDAGEAREQLRKSAEAAPNDPLALEAHAAFLGQHRDPAARDAYEWYARRSADTIGDLSDWVESRSGELGTYGYTDKIRTAARSGSKEVALNFDAMMGRNSVIAGDPDEIVERAKQYEAAGVDQLLCLLDPHDIPQENILQTIELVGEHVIPEFS